MNRGLIAVIIIFLLSCTKVFTQAESFISSPQEHYLIGDQIIIDFTLKLEEDFRMDMLDLSSLDSIFSLYGKPDSTGQMVFPEVDYSILDYGYWQTNENVLFQVKEENWDVRKLNDKKIFHNKLIISFWETGTFEIKDISYRFTNNDLLRIYFSGNSLILNISAPGDLEEMPADSIEIAPIKNIFPEPRIFADYLPYIYVILSLLLIVLLIYFLRRLNKEKKIEVPPEILRSPHEIAFEQLDALEKERLWENNKIKAFQSRLTHIIREYLENRYQIRALELTTEEIGEQLKEKDFEIKWKENLKRILQIADLVKFARATPPVEINQQFFEEAKAFIYDTMMPQNTPDLNPEEK